MRASHLALLLDGVADMGFSLSPSFLPGEGLLELHQQLYQQPGVAQECLGGARDCSAEQQTCSHRDVTADREPGIECLGLFSPVSSY